MTNYELLFILPGTLSEDETAPFVGKVKEILESNGANKLTVDDLGKSRLAYPIKHIRYGYFYLAHFQAEKTDVIKIQDKLRLVRELLRALVSKYDPNKKLVVGKVDSVSEIDTTKRYRTNVKKNTTSSREDKKTVSSSNDKKEEKKEESKEEKVEAAKESVEKTETEAVVPEKKTSKSKKVSMDDIDKKLDEILDIEISNV